MTVITIISAFIFLVLLWIVVGVKHLKNSKRILDAAWEFVDEKIRKRHDYAPVLVECVKLNSADVKFDTLVDKMIAARDKARRIYFPGSDKTENEGAFGGFLTEMIAFGEKSEAIKDTYFLEIKKEIFDINADISGRTRDYNEVASKYNHSLKNIFLKPLAFVLKAQNAESFNF